MKLLLLADGGVGLEIVRWLVANFRDDLELLVTTADNDLAAVAGDKQIRTLVFESSRQVHDRAVTEGLSFDLGLLAWWPKIIRQPLLTLPRIGFINTHPTVIAAARGATVHILAVGMKMIINFFRDRVADAHGVAGVPLQGGDFGGPTGARGDLVDHQREVVHAGREVLE